MEWTLIIAGILSLVLGIFLAIQPVAGLLVQVPKTCRAMGASVPRLNQDEKRSPLHNRSPDLALGLVWAIGIYAIIFGILLIVRTFQLRLREPSAPAAPV
jgi:hypothetical protein